MISVWLLMRNIWARMLVMFVIGVCIGVGGFREDLVVGNVSVLRRYLGK